MGCYAPGCAGAGMQPAARQRVRGATHAQGPRLSAARVPAPPAACAAPAPLLKALRYARVRVRGRKGECSSPRLAHLIKLGMLNGFDKARAQT